MTEFVATKHAPIGACTVAWPQHNMQRHVQLLRPWLLLQLSLWQPWTCPWSQLVCQLSPIEAQQLSPDTLQEHEPAVEQYLMNHHHDQLLLCPGQDI